MFEPPYAEQVRFSEQSIAVAEAPRLRSSPGPSIARSPSRAEVRPSIGRRHRIGPRAVNILPSLVE
jgi:hypothetical protein